MTKEELMAKYGITPTWWKIMEDDVPPGEDPVRHIERRMKNQPKEAAKVETLCGGHLRRNIASSQAEAKEPRER